MAAKGTRERIVEAAMELFWLKGYGSTSIADILSRSQVNSGSLYHFFPGKQDVLIAVLDRYRDGIGPMLLDPVWECVDDPIERIFALLGKYRELIVSTDCLYGCPIGSLALELHEPDPPVRERLAANFTGWADAVRTCLEAAGERIPPEVDRRALAEFVLTVMEGAVMQARTYRDVAFFDRAVAQLRIHFNQLERVKELAMIRGLALLFLAAFAVAPASASPEAQARTVVEADDNRTLVVEVEVAATPPDVWRAISTAEGWQSWAVPLARKVEGGDLDIIETSYDPTAQPGGPNTIWQWFVARIPGRMLAFQTSKAPQGFPDFDTYSRIVNVFELEARGERTLVRLTSHPYPNNEAGRRLLAFFERGNRATLDMLRRRFAEGPIDWSKERPSK